jgi:hypothetical protein
MKTLIIEIENVHSGKIQTSKQYVLGVNTEEEQKKYVSDLSSKMSRMHMTTDYKTSRIYFQK